MTFLHRRENFQSTCALLEPSFRVPMAMASSPLCITPHHRPHNRHRLPHLLHRLCLTCLPRHYHCLSMPPPAANASGTSHGVQSKVSEHRGGGEGGWRCFIRWLDVVGVAQVAPDGRRGYERAGATGGRRRATEENHSCWGKCGRSYVLQDTQLPVQRPVHTTTTNIIERESSSLGGIIDCFRRESAYKLKQTRPRMPSTFYILNHTGVELEHIREDMLAL